VKDGHKTPEPETSNYAGVVNRESVRIAFTYAALMGLPVMAADIRNAYRPEGPNRNSAASLDRGRRCLTPIYGEIQINSDQKFYRAQRRNYYVLDLVRKSL
jgi:hypothetical protein